MKTIKTPEEIIARFNLNRANLEFMAENFCLNGSLYADIKDAMRDYHAQFFSTSEEVEKAKEAFVEKWYVYAHGEARMFNDLNALIDLVQNETKAAPKMPTEEDIYGYIKLKRDEILHPKNANMTTGNITLGELTWCNLCIDVTKYFLSHLQEPENKEKILTEFADKLISSQKDIDPEIVEVVNDHFMEMLQEPEAPEEKKIIDALSGEEIKDVHTITSTTYPSKEEKKECPKCLKGCMDDTCIYHPNNR
jgi:hypothetical protein